MIDIVHGDCMDLVKTLPPCSYHCCVTSPPYGGSVRDYKVPPTPWPEVSYVPMSGLSPIVVPGETSCLGLERTPEAYVAHLVAIFREVRGCLRDDGTLWVTIDDTFNAYNGNRGTKSKFAGNRLEKEPKLPTGYGLMVRSLKQKDRVGFPWRLAFALQADGWYLRMDNIWNKEAPMPESIRDRTTRSHEYVFLLSKRVKYSFNIDAVREPGGRKRRSVWTIQQRSQEGHYATYPEEVAELCIKAGSPVGGRVLDPFGGSGTTAAVCKRLGRSCTNIELNPSYVDQSRDRLLETVGPEGC